MKLDDIIMYGRYYRDEESTCNWWYCRIDDHMYETADLISSFGFESENQIEEDDRYVKMYKTDIIELEKNFLKEIGSLKVLEGTTDFNQDIAFNKFIDQENLYRLWFDYETIVLRENAIKWGEDNHIIFTGK